MQMRDAVGYRLALAQGFLNEAEQDLKLERWRSCVDNAQLVVENAGKAVLALFGITPKTHDPAREIAAILRTQDLPDAIQQELRQLLPDLLALGTAEHFLTDYGDEATYTLPWELFTKESAMRRWQRLIARCKVPKIQLQQYKPGKRSKTAITRDGTDRSDSSR